PRHPLGLQPVDGQAAQTPQSPRARVRPRACRRARPRRAALMFAEPQTLTAVDERLEALLAERIERAKAMGPAYQRLWMRIRASLRGGKRVRPQLLLHAHAALGGRDKAAAVSAAAAFELLHTALLIHDDMLDG